MRKLRSGLITAAGTPDIVGLRPGRPQPNRGDGDGADRRATLLAGRELSHLSGPAALLLPNFPREASPDRNAPTGAAGALNRFTDYRTVGWPPVIALQNVTKIYPASTRPALDGVSLDIDKGEFVFLIGASGSGKSSVLRLLLREDTPTKGSVIVNGKDIARLPGRKVPELRRGIGCVFQDFRLLPKKTVFENVAFALEVINKSQRSISRSVPEVLEMVGLDGKAHRYPNELSGGEQQRVAIARAFVNRPLVLLADEPTGNLDPDTSQGIMGLLERINRKGTTVVMATHDNNIVDAMRRRVIELDLGHVVRDQNRGVYGVGR
jgi:cell division transport system ATP-binding protein